MKIVDYEILVQDLISPIGNTYNFYAVIQFLVVETPEGNKRIDPGLGESHGHTKEEARERMQEKFDRWKEENC